MTRTQARQRAREVYAAALVRAEPKLTNAANNVRAGFENLWISPALDALADCLLRLDDEDDAPEVSRTETPNGA